MYFHVAGATYREVFDAWFELEPGLVGRVARLDDREEVIRVFTPFGDPTSVDVNDPEAVFYQSADFHSAVGRLSGNRVLVLLLQSINHILTELMMERIDMRVSAPLIEHDHVELAHAILKGHARKAEDLARAHIEHLRTSFEDASNGRIDEIVEWR